MATKDTYTDTHHGTRQTDRFPEALSADYVRIDERSFQDMVWQVYRYAKQLKFFNAGNCPDGDWEAFFHSISTFDKNEKNYVLDLQKMETQMQHGDIQPHLALLLSFLKLFSLEQDNLNTLNERHLDFYYKDVLRFTPRIGSPGKACVFFDLNKAAKEVSLPKGSLFDAGKDDENRAVYYASTDEITLNKARISRVNYKRKSVFRSLDIPLEIPPISTEKTIGEDFALMLSSELFLLPDGERNFVMHGIQLSDFSAVSYTTEKGWEKAGISGNTICIRAGQAAFTAYNTNVHKGNLPINTPVLKLHAKQCVLPEISNVHCVVSLKNSQHVEIRNAFGIVPNSKGSFPFGTQCREMDGFDVILPHVPDTVPSLLFSCSSEETLPVTAYSITANANSRNIHVVLRNNTYNQVEIARAYAQYLLQLQKATVEEAKKLAAPKSYRIPELSQSIRVEYRYTIPKNHLQFFPQTPQNPLCDKASASLTVCRNFYGDTAENSLYIRLDNLQDARMISLYFHLDPLKSSGGKISRWSFFDGKNWQGIHSADVFKDTTHQLQYSGIVNLRLNTPLDSCWLKADFEADYSFHNILNIYTQVAELAYSDKSLGRSIHGCPLAANTICKSVQHLEGIKKIEQRFPGQEGTYDESEESFACRVSEKLRHKGRAWNTWDYERIVLEKFPQIAAVKCIPTYCKENGNTFEAGSICLLLIPGKNVAEQESILSPKVPEALRIEVLEYLKGCCSPFIALHVYSPDYAEVKISCQAKLCKGYVDINHYQSLLGEQLLQFLAPWATDREASSFYRELNESDILSFIEDTGYIDHIEALKVSLGGQNIPQGGSIIPQNLTTLLTSAAKHDITLTTI